MNFQKAIIFCNIFVILDNARLSIRTVPIDTIETQEQTPEEKMANSHFVDVVETNPYSTSIKLVYDSETHIVYYYQNYEFDKKAASSLCPYYSANGYICHYNTETNQIEEIIH